MGRLSSRVAKFAVWFGAFTLIFLLVFSYRYLGDLATGHSGTFSARLIEELTGSYTWGLLFLLVLKFSRRFRIDARNWPRRLPAYLSAAVVFSLLHLPPRWMLHPQPIGLDGEEIETGCELKGLALRRTYG